MKELFDIFVKDYKNENFTRRDWVTGCAITAIIVLTVCLANLIQ